MKQAIRCVYVAGLVALAGCGGAPKVSRVDPLADAMDTSKDSRTRAAAIDVARTQAGADPQKVAEMQKAFKTLVWDQSALIDLRLRALTSLINDPDPKVAADARDMGRLILPHESSREIVVYLSKTAGERGWTEYCPALVRSYSRPLPARVKDEIRTERIALEQLNPGKPIQEIVFATFLNPPEQEVTYGVDWKQRARTDAWDLMARLDPSGESRAKLLDKCEGSDDPLLSAIAAARRELRIVPLTGAELDWLLSLRDPKKPENAAWWAEVKTAVAALPGGEVLYLRHAEPIRWAAANRSPWLSMSREQLYNELAGRLHGRPTNFRAWHNTKPTYGERLEDSRERLRWGDLLAMLEIDDALKEPGVTAALLRQAELDHKDTTTEYGGVLWHKGAGADATLYPPRPGQRHGDTNFVASDDMIAASDRALAHYHFHVQHWNSSDFAGPSEGDLQYAAHSGRACVVLSGIKEGILGVDYYQADGSVVDMGEIGR